MRTCAAEYARDPRTKTQSRVRKNAPSSQIRRVRTAGTSANAAPVRREDSRERRPVANRVEAL
jgi:hypothetical protein